MLLSGSIHSPTILCFRSMAAKTLRKAESSRWAFKSNVSAACGSDCGRLRSWAPRPAETTLVDSRNWMRRSQDSSALEGVAFTKSTESRPPNSRRADLEKGIGRASWKERKTKSIPVQITSKKYHNGYRDRSALWTCLPVTFCEG